MTKKLFYKNQYIKEFSANISKLIEKKGKYHVILNHTAFYPEGGGQPSDTGKIDDIPVSYVYEEDGTIYHVLDKIPTKLEDVTCIVDWEKRFDYMQQHLGQHILSSAFEKLHNARTIGFHLSSEFTTIDINVQLSKNDISKVEYLANQIVFNDLQVSCIYPTKDELEKLPLRKPPTVKDNIRVVKIDDFDYSPCCGTHPNRTGEVGLIKIRKFENYKGGMRIEFLCGNRALKDYYWKNEAINLISSILSVKDKEAVDAIKRIYDENNENKKEIGRLKESIITYEANDIYKNSQSFNSIKIILEVFENRDLNEVKTLSSILASKEKVIILFGIKNKDKAQLVFSRSQELKEINMNGILKECITIIDGKGGGNSVSAQGGGKNIANLNSALQHGLNRVAEIVKSL